MLNCPSVYCVYRCHEEQSCVLFDYICSHYKTGLSPDQQQRVKDLISSGHREPQVGIGFSFFYGAGVAFPTP